MTLFFERGFHDECRLLLRDWHTLSDEAAGCRFGGALRIFGSGGSIVCGRLVWGLSPEFANAQLQLYPGQVFAEFILSR